MNGAAPVKKPMRRAAPAAWTALATTATIAAAATLGACAVGPNYTAPAEPRPTEGAFVSSTPAIATADEPPANWWRLYDTPALDVLVRAALTHNNDLLAAAANLAKARAALSLARVGYFPSTTASAGAQYGVNGDTVFASQLRNLAPAGAEMNYSAGLDVSYEVDLSGRIRRTVQAAAADYQAQQAAEDIARVSVAGETTRAYVNACAYAQELEVARESLRLVTQSDELTKKEADAGAATDLDVARADELVSQSRAMLPVYEGQRRTALFELAVLTGRPPEDISPEADHCTAAPTLTTVLPVGDITSLFKRRPDVRQAERQLASSVARIGVASADLYPTITIGAAGATGSDTIHGLGSRANWSFGVGPLLSWSFPNIAAAHAQVREARAVASAAYANFQAAVLQALQDTENALTAYRSELERNAALLNARDQSQAAFGLAQTGFQLGRLSYLDLLIAETDLVNANAALAASNQALASDQVTVFKSLGGGWQQAPEVLPLKFPGDPAAKTSSGR